jgi:hypothetical protein
VLGGYASSPESNFGAAYLVKTDSLGNEQWNRTYPAKRVFSLQQTADEGYVLAGAMYYSGQNDYCDFWILKTDSNGNTQWDRTFDCTRLINITPDSLEEAYCVRQTIDGGYILAGRTFPYGERSAAIWIVKTDTDGNIQTDLVYGGENSREDVAYSVQETHDGAYIAAGYTIRNEDPYPIDVLLIKFNLITIIPEFMPHLILPIFVMTTLALAAIVVFRKRRTAIRVL